MKKQQIASLAHAARAAGTHSAGRYQRLNLTDGQLCVLQGLIAIGIEEHSKDFTCRDFLELVRIHRRFCKSLGHSPDYDFRGGAVVEARNGAVKALFPLLQRRKPQLALSNG